MDKPFNPFPLEQDCPKSVPWAKCVYNFTQTPTSAIKSLAIKCLWFIECQAKWSAPTHFYVYKSGPLCKKFGRPCPRAIMCSECVMHDTTYYASHGIILHTQGNGNNEVDEEITVQKRSNKNRRIFFCTDTIKHCLKSRAHYISLYTMK